MSNPKRAVFRFVMAAAAAWLTLGICSNASAADVGAELVLGEVYTSNLRLLPDDMAESQWVTAVTPRVYVAHDAPRFEFDLDYELQALFYAGESQLNEAYSGLWTTGIFDLLDDELFLRGFARVTQVNLDPELPVTDGNINITDNRSDAHAWELGPRWTRGLVGESEIEAFYYVGRIDYDNADTQGVDTQTGRIEIESSEMSEKALSYKATYNYRDYDYDNTGPVNYQDIQLELGYLTSPSLELIGVIGSESNLAENNGVLDEPYWQAGFRTWFGKNELEATYGERFYGPTYWVTWTRNVLYSKFRLSYRETQDTDESLAVRDIGDDADAGLDPMRDTSLSPNSDLARPGSGNRAVYKRGIADYRWSRNRSEVRLAVFWTDREEFSALDPSLPPGTGTTDLDTSIGAGFDLKWDIGVRTNSWLYGRWTDRHFNKQEPDGGSRSDLYRIDWRLIYYLGTKTEMRFDAGYQRQNGGLFDYNEVHAAISIERFFGGADIRRR